jgi:CheY-like chemotaxis protein
MAGFHIVITDDDPDERLIFCEIAQDVDKNIQVTALPDCESLFRFLNRNNAPNVIFLDLNMPIMSGQGCLKQLKEHVDWQKIPVVVYSTVSRQEIIDDCYSRGAALYVTKPNDANTLKALIMSVIKKFMSTVSPTVNSST